jgi:homogentisate phytyltransferase/homogentisate geranylgeranyltransferase
LLWAWVACIGGNIYIVGLNQLTDVAIDRINKPYLPLASGAFTLATGRRIVALCGALALALALWQGRFLLITVGVSLLIGSAYSLPPIRLKRFHFWAAACIFTVRGVVINLFLFLHFNERLGGAAGVPAHVWVLTGFIFFFSLVIAWLKDVPDTEGDRRFAIATLSLQVGRRRVFQLSQLVLGLCYAGMVAAGAIGLPGVNNGVLIVTHLLLGGVAWQFGRNVDLDSTPSVTRYYLRIWILFFAEYIAFSLSALLAA